MRRKRRYLILLSLGGAERLIVDAALGLQNAGYDVRIFTSHHDPAHSFEETNDGMFTSVSRSSSHSEQMH